LNAPLLSEPRSEILSLSRQISRWSHLTEKRHKLRSAKSEKVCAHRAMQFSPNEKNLIDETLCKKCNGRAFAPNCAHVKTRLQTCNYILNGRSGLFFFLKVFSSVLKIRRENIVSSFNLLVRLTIFSHKNDHILFTFITFHSNLIASWLQACFKGKDPNGLFLSEEISYF
jgi:hypothetical protein